MLLGRLLDPAQLLRRHRVNARLPHGTDFELVEAKLLGHADGEIEVLGDFVGNDGSLEHGTCLPPYYLKLNGACRWTTNATRCRLPK